MVRIHQQQQHVCNRRGKWKINKQPVWSSKINLLYSAYSFCGDLIFLLIWDLIWLPYLVTKVAFFLWLWTIHIQIIQIYWMVWTAHFSNDQIRVSETDQMWQFISSLINNHLFSFEFHKISSFTLTTFKVLLLMVQNLTADMRKEGRLIITSSIGIPNKFIQMEMRTIETISSAMFKTSTFAVNYFVQNIVNYCVWFIWILLELLSVEE